MAGQRWETPAPRDAGSGSGAFGAELRRWRAKRELSLAGLARLTHYSKSYLSKIETGDKRPNRDLASRCDDALEAGVSCSSWCRTPRTRSRSPRLATTR
ncbi:hypothetical protein GCM10029964_083350 [Kibdelosporangium lantanae]